ncbi:hypothetical protein CQW49_23260 (plasmid) [Methylosinus trichosporium OB3b]|uniref:Conjugal transfer protein n=1 Tax=Methylosinus trichosporium (strain ATCC 35070 / NCIMB 11131 / UNIQEM 75 / OB3b) TaxID=595536 RepID=A0A2D2D778_METT3|nr:hypothetical protein [Methylosinus trichosporium]ATQ70871.1 hypothetical protein CQW49_23260 [Methylosinus trichosporium OB3b]
MNKTSHLLSATTGVVIGAVVFGAAPANAQLAVFDETSIAVQQGLQKLQDQANNFLNTITGQLGLNGPLASLLGSNSYGDVTTLLRQGFTQNANYSKAQVSAQRQIADASNSAMARFERDKRNAVIRDEHVVSPLHCAHLDNGQTITVGAGQSWKVAAAIQTVADQRGEAAKGTPSYYGAAQAVEAINMLHYSRYCSADEAAAGFCSASQRENADQRASSLFGTGTYDGQDGVNSANDYVTNLVQPIVPTAQRGGQMTSLVAKEASVRRRQYESRISLARSVLNEVLAAQSPSVPLNAAQKQQMQNEGLTAVDTGSWVQALQLDVHRRYSDVNWAAQLQSMTPAAVEREIANELAVTNYLLLENYRMAMKNASVNATTLAAVAERDLQTLKPAVELPTPNLSN